jgi:SAM-dependent methyltransferase
VIDIAAWLDVGADEKAASIAALAPPAVGTVIEIGCGTGAVLEALDRRGFGEAYWACEPEASLFAQIRREKISRLVDASPTTFDEAFGDQRFDLAILTHVVEHLLTPAELVTQALRRARHVFIEVPLDNNAAGWTRAQIRILLGRDRRDNKPGHVQFFSRRSARELVRYSGGQVLAERGYFPHAAALASADSLHRRVVAQAARIDLLGRAYYEHFAMLAEVATIGEWSHHYHKPL